MNAVLANVRQLVDVELAAANERVSQVPNSCCFRSSTASMRGGRC